MFSEETIGDLTDKEYNSLLGIYGYDFVVKYINKSNLNDKKLKERILSLESNFKKLDKCIKFIGLQKTLLVKNNNIRSHYMKRCDKLYSDMISFFENVNKEKIIKTIGEKKFMDIFLSAILIDLGNTNGSELPKYFDMLSKQRINIIINSFVFSNFIGDYSVKSNVYKLYKKLGEGDYKERLENSDSEYVSLETGHVTKDTESKTQKMSVIKMKDIDDLLKYITDDKFKSLVDNTIPNIRFFDLIDGDKIIKKCVIKMIKNFIYKVPKNNNDMYENIFFEKYGLLTVPLYIIKSNKEDKIVYDNIYHKLMDTKYSA